MKQRELKFRAWNGAEMVYDVTVGKFGAFYVNPGSKGNGLDEKDSASLTPFNTKYSEDAPIMMRTGLQDRTGKQIYQGDIVTDGMNKTAIEWDNEMQCWSFTRHEDGSLYNEKELVILGNIYANPELLKP